MRLSMITRHHRRQLAAPHHKVGQLQRHLQGQFAKYLFHNSKTTSVRFQRLHLTSTVEQLGLFRPQIAPHKGLLPLVTTL
ncbi:hypothetical protein HZS61_012792 [Fusarium oxysporum f. sp. conglutinans]|uniref:Uncharacterized protein n=1 Tax=Fusarium oxysporum f. sp. conglutinans TaxID=100902 RepID=A0A8H6GCF1_FUSOX|nr:hypothetical protein HZS61_005359 [Fusarium oxysporum f. sp. conglutinans]KAF6524293.1 hypothetical protein HZS61_012792 [Fusarium oxysporum f. sp. conglutinans]